MSDCSGYTSILEEGTVDNELHALGRGTKEQVNHPQHYGGKDNPYEAIKVIDAWSLSFCLGNAVKYLARAGKKDSAKLVEDLEKASWYLNHEIAKVPSLTARKIPADMQPEVVAAYWDLSKNLTQALLYIGVAVASYETKTSLLMHALKMLREEIAELKGGAA